MPLTCEYHFNLALVRDSDRVALTKEAGCDGLYCARVDMKHKTFYEHCQLHVQASVNWGNNNMGDKTAHDASALWVEDVSGKGFKVCVREAGRRDLANPPHVSWFAYQGMLENVSRVIYLNGSCMMQHSLSRMLIMFY